MKNKVVYDSECSLCIDIKNRLEHIDNKNNFEWIPSKLYIIRSQKHYKIDKKLIDKTIIVIKRNNKILTEFKACRYIISRIPLFYPFLIFLYIPFISNLIGNIIYRTVSKNRKCNI